MAVLPPRLVVFLAVVVLLAVAVSLAAGLGGLGWLGRRHRGDPLRLELERIDLHDIVTEVATHAREWAHKVGLTLNVDVAPDAGAPVV